MRKLIYLFILGMVVSGCMTPLIKPQVTEMNRENLTKLSVGMTKRQVSKVMKDQTFVLGGANVTPFSTAFSPMWTLKNPLKSEIFEGKDGKSLEVRYYIVDGQKESPEVADEEMTPLVFEDGKLIGWGWDFLNENRKE